MHQIITIKRNNIPKVYESCKILLVEGPQRASLNVHYVGERHDGNPMLQSTFYTRTYTMASYKKS
jgi:hypothetical protein